MTRHLAIFAACFLLGALAVAALRTASHEPYSPAVPAAAPVPAAPAADPHAGHAATPPVQPAPVIDPKPVNTVCAICGMDVDPKLPTATYAGKTIGFGCKACPPRFAKDPEKYGPAFLENRVVE
jgi:hypothetical protein